MGYVFDILIAAIIVLTVFTAYKKGFIKTVLSTLGFFIAIAVAFSLQPKITELIIKTPAVDGIRESVREKFISLSPVDKPDEFDSDKLMNEKPDEFKSLLSIIGIDQAALNAQYNDWKTDVTESAADKLVEYVADPLIKNVAAVIAFIALFVAASIALGIAIYILDRVCRLPVLRQANKALGFVTGILLGVFKAYVFGIIITLIWPFVVSEHPNLAINGSLIFRFFYDEANIFINFIR